jgi:hypothetical protein
MSNDPPNLGTVADRTIIAKKDTCFKFLAKRTLISGNDTFLEATDLTFGPPGYGARCNQNMIDDKGVASLELEDYPPASGKGIVSFNCVLVLQVDSIPVFIKLLYNSPPATTRTNNFYTVQAPHDGQTFTFLNYDGKVNDHNVIVVYRNGTMNQEYDEVINIDDLLSAWQLLRPFGYKSQKLVDPDTQDVIQNPAGSYIMFIRTAFGLGVTSTAYKTRLGVFEHDDYEVTKNIVPQYKSIATEVEVTINAIRIENNTKKAKP